MDVRVHGKNMQVDDMTRRLANEKVQHAGRILDGGGSADVEFAERTNPRRSDGRFSVEITSHTKGQTVRVEAAAADDRAALDIAVEKYERQLRRLKERLIQRSRSANGRNAVVEADTDSSDSRTYEIVRTKRFETRPMSADEAVLQMEMLGHDFFFFLDADSGKHCVLYHRKDGALGLIEPS